MTRHRQGLLVVARKNQLLELWRTGDVGALAHIHKIGGARHVERLESGQSQRTGMPDLGHLPWRMVAHRRSHPRDVLGRRAAAPADDIKQTLPSPIAQLWRQRLGCFRKSGRRERIRQARVRVHAQENR